MLVVTGANGRLGSQIVHHLLDRVPASEVGVSVRDVGDANSLTERGVRVRRGDFTDAGSLQHAFEGADQVLVVSAAIRGPGAAAANRAAIDAAVQAGARRVLYTSHQAASFDSLFPAQPQHAATEEYLAGRGVEWTALRHGFYASTLEIYLPAALQTGELRLPEDGPWSWTAHADLAEADAIALTHPELLTSPTPVLTASAALDLAQVAAVLSERSGRTIRRVVLDDETWKDEAIQHGLPPAAADFSLGMFRAARRGEFDVVDPTLEALLGRPPVAVDATIDALARPTA